MSIAERFGRLQIDGGLKLRREFDRDVAGLGTLEDLVDKDGGASVHRGKVGTVADEAARCRQFKRPDRSDAALGGDRGNRGDREALAREYVDNDDRADFLFRPARERALELLGPDTSIDDKSTTSAFAAARITSRMFGVDATPRWKSAPALDIDGKISLSSSSRFAISSGRKKFEPVTLPPGWARLAARPIATTSPAASITIGMVVVARRAA